MNSAWLPALGLALVLVVGVVVLLLLRGRRVPPPAVQRKPVAAAAPAVPPPDSAVAEIDARRQATTEALRLARQRKADEAARLEAEHAAQARAAAAARTTPPTTPPTPAPVVPRPQAGWASRPMGLDPAEPITPRPVPTPAVRPAAAAPAPVVAAPERALAPLPPLSPPQSPPQSPPAAPPLRPPAPSRVPVVLVADDSKVVRVKTSRLLEKQGWQVLLADDGAAALQLLDAHTPDLLITDVEMPGVDGFTLTREVRSHARCARLPVIMITSSDERHRAEAHAVGVDLLLGKPYAEETLLAQAQRLLGVTTPVPH